MAEVTSGTLISVVISTDASTCAHTHLPLARHMNARFANSVCTNQHGYLADIYNTLHIPSLNNKNIILFRSVSIPTAAYFMHIVCCKKLH